MFQIAIWAAVLGVAYMTGNIIQVLLMIFAWLFFKKAVLQGGGISGGLQHVVFKVTFLFLMYLAVESDRVTGSTAIAVFLIGFAGLNFDPPTISLPKQKPGSPKSEPSPPAAGSSSPIKLADVVSHGLKRK